MKKSIAIFFASALLGSLSFANTNASRYDLVSKNYDDCPAMFLVQVTSNQVQVLPTFSGPMNSPGPFGNTLYFQDFSDQWKVTESSSAGTFSVKTVYGTTMAKSFVSKEEKLERLGKTLRHTRKTLTMENQTAYLTYDILALDKRATAEAYTNILCQYTATK